MPSWSGLDDEPFDPATSPVTPDLGVVSDTFWRLPNVKRSAHPFAFAAAGPQAEQIISDPLPLPPHSPASPVAVSMNSMGRYFSSAWDTMPTRRCILPS